MKRNSLAGWVPVLLLAVLAAALCAGCDDDKYDSVNASVAVAADRSALTLYTDDTLVTYTVTTPKQCTIVTLQRMDPNNEGTVLSEQQFQQDSAGVLTRVEGQTRVWTIPCDFGRVGVYGVRVKAQVPMGKRYDTLYANADVTIAYPAHDAEALAQILAQCTLLGDEPYRFTCTGDAAEEMQALLEGGADDVYTRMAETGTAVLGGNFLFGDRSLLVLTEETDESMPVPAGETLYRLYIPSDAYTACYTGGGLMITDAARAVIAYRNGMSIDAQRYPVAALLLEKGTAALEAMSLSGAGDAETARAVYEWVYNACRMSVLPDEIAALPEAEKAYYLGTAYGVLSGFGGDAYGCSDAYWLLMNMAGAKCAVYACEREDGTQTRVNLVLLDGEWYFCDAYLDSLTEARSADAVFAHFGLNTAQAGEYLTWTQDAPPESTSTQYAGGSRK